MGMFSARHVKAPPISWNRRQN